MAKQEKSTEESNRILSIAKQKGIRIIYVEAGQRIKLDKGTYLEIMYIGKDIENLNNSSIIARLQYNSFSMLFTGDSERKEEIELMQIYNNTSIKADVLKVAHHGSSTSSLAEFIEMVKPKIALIGVGKNNNFGHPSKEVENLLEYIGSKIYRTDLCGEIVIKVDSIGKAYITTNLKE